MILFSWKTTSKCWNLSSESKAPGNNFLFDEINFVVRIANNKFHSSFFFLLQSFPFQAFFLHEKKRISGCHDTWYKKQEVQTNNKNTQKWRCEKKSLKKFSFCLQWELFFVEAKCENMKERRKITQTWPYPSCLDKRKREANVELWKEDEKDYTRGICSFPSTMLCECLHFLVLLVSCVLKLNFHF